MSTTSMTVPQLRIVIAKGRRMNNCRDFARSNRSMDASSVRRNVTICGIGPHGRSVHATTVIDAPILSEQLAYFMNRLVEYKDNDGSLLDNTIVLFGSGASTTHNPTNLPTLIAGGANMGLKHGAHWRKPNTPMSNVYLSILRSLKIEENSFSDSSGVLRDSIFSAI